VLNADRLIVTTFRSRMARALRRGRFCRIGNSGINLIEVMIASGIMTVMAVAFAQMMGNQQRETRALAEKLAALDYQGLLGKILADGTVCTFDLTNTTLPANTGNPKSFVDGSVITPFSLGRIHSSSVGASPPVFAQAGSRVSPTVSVASISVGNITKIAAQKYTAEIQVYFSGSLRNLKPAVSSVVLKTDGGVATPGRETIIKCSLQDDAAPQTGGYARASRSDYLDAYGAVIPLDNTIPQNNEGTEILSLPYAAKQANSKLLITVDVVGCAATLNWPTAALFRSGSTNAIGVRTAVDHHVNQSGWAPQNISFTAEYSPGTTNSITYSVRVGRFRLNGCSGPLFGGTFSSSLVIQEIMQ